MSAEDACGLSHCALVFRETKNNTSLNTNGGKPISPFSVDITKHVIQVNLIFKFSVILKNVNVQYLLIKVCFSVQIRILCGKYVHSFKERKNVGFGPGKSPRQRLCMCIYACATA